MRIKTDEVKKIIDEEFIKVAREVRRLTEREAARALRTLAEQPDDEDIKPGDYLEVMVSDDGYETSAEPIQPAEYKNQRSYSTSFKALVKVEAVAEPADMYEGAGQALKALAEQPIDTEPAVQQIEGVLKDLSDQGLDNEGLKKILTQIIHDIDKGFVGEPT